MILLTNDDSTLQGIKLYKQHNAITSGRYDFSQCQLDILFMVLASLKEDKLTYRIKVKDIELLTGRTWNYQQLKASTEDMGSRMFEIEDAESYKQVWLFSEVSYIKGKGEFEISISDRAKHLFFELKNNFTYFQLKSVLACNSKFAKRLYMIACQWKSIGKFPKPVKISDLKEMLGLVDKKGIELYSRIADFKKNVLDIAKKQINEQTDLSFDFELFKHGRSFEYIQIYISNRKDEPKQLAIDFNESVDYQKDVRSIMAYGIEQDHAELIVKDGMDNFISFVEKVNQRAKKGEINVENAAAYIIGAYQKKGIIPKK